MTTNTLATEGMTRAVNAADPRVVLTIDAAIERAIASGEPFSANDIRDQFATTQSKGLVGRASTPTPTARAPAWSGSAPCRATSTARTARRSRCGVGCGSAGCGMRVYRIEVDSGRLPTTNRVYYGDDAAC